MNNINSRLSMITDNLSTAQDARTQALIELSFTSAQFTQAEDNQNDLTALQSILATAQGYAAAT